MTWQEISDEQWAVLAPLFLAPKRTGRPPSVPHPAGHHGHHPRTRGPEGRPGPRGSAAAAPSTPGLQGPQRRRTLLQQAQAVARNRHPLRQDRPRLPRRTHPRRGTHLDPMTTFTNTTWRWRSTAWCHGWTGSKRRSSGTVTATATPGWRTSRARSRPNSGHALLDPLTGIRPGSRLAPAPYAQRLRSPHRRVRAIADILNGDGMPRGTGQPVRAPRERAFCRSEGDYRSRSRSSSVYSNPCGVGASILSGGAYRGVC